MTETEIVDPYNTWHRGVLFVDEGRTFYQNRSFRFFIGLPIVIGLAAYIALFFGPDSPWAYSFEFTPKGYANALSIVKFPMYMFTVAIGAGVMVARMHRSKVVNRSIEVAERNNNFMQRAKHEEEFLKVAGRLPDATILLDKWKRITVRLENKHHLYKAFFPENKTHVADLTPAFGRSYEIIKQICRNLESGLSVNATPIPHSISIDYILRYCTDVIPVTGEFQKIEKNDNWTAVAKHNEEELMKRVLWFVQACIDFTAELQCFMGDSRPILVVQADFFLEKYAPGLFLVLNQRFGNNI